MNFNYQELMKQAHAAQRQMEKIQEELKKLAVDKGEDPYKVKVEIPIVPETVQEEIKISSL